MKKAILCLVVEYDEQITDPESLATAVDRLLETALSTPDIFDDYGNPHIFGCTTLEGMRIPVRDDARPAAKPLTVQVSEDAFGVGMTAFSADEGRELGKVVIDLHNRKLQALVYEPNVDNPAVVHVFCLNTEAES